MCGGAMRYRLTIWETAWRMDRLSRLVMYRRSMAPQRASDITLAMDRISGFYQAFRERSVSLSRRAALT